MTVYECAVLMPLVQIHFVPVGECGHAVRWCPKTEFQQEYVSFCCPFLADHAAARVVFIAELQNVILSPLRRKWPLSPGHLMGITRLCRESAMRSGPQLSAMKKRRGQFTAAPCDRTLLKMISQ